VAAVTLPRVTRRRRSDRADLCHAALLLRLVSMSASDLQDQETLCEDRT
jgi:hypothetical protein